MGTYTGTAGGDTITSALVSSGVDAVPPGSKPSAADDTIDGLGGKDTLGGGGGNDTISAAGSGSVMHGDAGNDSITYDTDADAVSTWAYGDAGNDSIGFSSFQQSGGSPAGTLSFYGGTGNDTISSSGTDSSDYSGLTVNSYGQVGDDRLEATKAFTFSMAYPWFPDGNDNLYGGPGNDSYWVLEPADAAIERPNEGYDTVEVYDTDYTLGANVEKLIIAQSDHNQGHRYTGNAPNNHMTGSYGGDTISGLGGNDTLYGGRGGDDTLAGGDGFDRLYGEDGSDRFDYDAISESKPGSGNRDVIYDFSGVGTTGADQIDLSSIDAIAGGSDDPFAFIGTAAFTAPGQLRVRDVSATNTNTLIQANTTGTSGPELEIVVVDGDTVASGQWTGGDFIL